MFNMYNRRYTGSKYKLMEWIRELIKDNCEVVTNITKDGNMSIILKQI